jgi:hypothetical protein
MILHITRLPPRWFPPSPSSLASSLKKIFFITQEEDIRRYHSAINNMADDSDLQRRFDVENRAASLGEEATMGFLVELHAAGEYAAFAVIWDTAKSRLSAASHFFEILI